MASFFCWSAFRLPGISPQAPRRQGVGPLSSIPVPDKEMTCQKTDGARIFSKSPAVESTGRHSNSSLSQTLWTWHDHRKSVCSVRRACWEEVHARIQASRIRVGSCHCCTLLSKYLNSQIQCRHDASFNNMCVYSLFWCLNKPISFAEIMSLLLSSFMFMLITNL